MDARTVYAAVPHLGEGALGGLTVPDESVICTWTTNLALATDAVRRGAALLRGHRVEAVRLPDSPEGLTVLVTGTGEIEARWVVNAAGLGSDHVDRMFGHDRFVVTPRRGELVVFDKLARPQVPTIVLPVPSSLGKGVLVSPTIYGNVMLGPTAEDLADRSATSPAPPPTARTGELRWAGVTDGRRRCPPNERERPAIQQRGPASIHAQAARLRSKPWHSTSRRFTR